MKHYATSASEQELTLLADSVSQAGLADKALQLQNSETSSFSFGDDDELTIESGFATIQVMISKVDGNVKTTKYFAFPGKVKHANDSVEPCAISLRQLVQPTIVLTDPKDKGITRNQLVKRFGNVTIEYRDMRDSNGTVVTLPYIRNEVKLHIKTGDVWVPDFNSFDKSSKSWQATLKEDYGYVKLPLNSLGANAL